jgi:prepilin-type N-terminal cleavage/methylation domain-containing protein
MGKINMINKEKKYPLESSSSVVFPFRKPDGFTMVEVIITILILTSGLLVLFTVFNMTIRDAVTSRNWMIAEMIADSMLEEILDHEYGTPMPSSWNKPQEVKAIIQGRPVVITYTRKVTAKYGSFTGNVSGNYDQVDVTISWKEGTGPEGSPRIKHYNESVWVRRNYL